MIFTIGRKRHPKASTGRKSNANESPEGSKRSFGDKLEAGGLPRQAGRARRGLEVPSRRRRGQGQGSGPLTPGNLGAPYEKTSLLNYAVDKAYEPYKP